MDFLTAMQTPIVRGRLRFLRLEMDDMAAMCAEIAEPKIALRKAGILADPQLRQNPVARSQAIAELDQERDRIDMVYLLSRADSPEWIGRFLARGLIKAGCCATAEEAAALIRANLHYSEQRTVAFEILCPPVQEDAKSPLGVAAENGSAATGSPTSPSSEGGVASTPEN